MRVGLDGVDLDTVEHTVDLSIYRNFEEKYVAAVDNKIDLLITKDKKTAEYFRENNVAVMLKI